MRCRDDGTTLEPKEHGFVCPECKRTVPYKTKTRHEPKRHHKAPSTDKPLMVRT